MNHATVQNQLSRHKGRDIFRKHVVQNGLIKQLMANPDVTVVYIKSAKGQQGCKQVVLRGLAKNHQLAIEDAKRSYAATLTKKIQHEKRRLAEKSYTAQKVQKVENKIRQLEETLLQLGCEPEQLSLNVSGNNGNNETLPTTNQGPLPNCSSNSPSGSLTHRQVHLANGAESYSGSTNNDKLVALLFQLLDNLHKQIANLHKIIAELVKENEHLRGSKITECKR